MTTSIYTGRDNRWESKPTIINTKKIEAVAAVDVNNQVQIRPSKGNTLEISLIDSEEEATSITPANGELSICFSLIFLHVNNTLFASTSHFHKQYVLHSVIFYFFFWCLGFWNSRVIARTTRLTLMGSSVLDCKKPALQIQSLEQIHLSALLCGRY